MTNENSITKYAKAGAYVVGAVVVAVVPGGIPAATIVYAIHRYFKPEDLLDDNLRMEESDLKDIIEE